MADFVSHYLFGELALEAFPTVVQLAAARRPAAFNWGLQGPDPLFYRSVAFGSPLHKYGNQMHSEHTDELFFAFSRAVNRMTGENRAIAEAYFYGFLCHYALDSTLHPYVYCRQYECQEADPNLNASAVHCQIESDIDYALYDREYHAPVTEFDPGKYYQLAHDELAVLAVLLHYLLKTVYQVEVSTHDLRSAFREILTAERFLYSEHRAAYRGIQRVEGLLGKGALLSSHMKIEAPEWNALNLGHAPWRNLWHPEQERTESVPELFDSAIQTAVHLAGEYAAEFDAGWLLLHHFDVPFDNGSPKKLA
ncbi:MAG: hypothetical protein KH319_05175 [Butyricicoccus pullicaecorum]|nr:hypothetical protein [Butyricicoccus pullicaecorum]